MKQVQLWIAVCPFEHRKEKQLMIRANHNDKGLVRTVFYEIEKQTGFLVHEFDKLIIYKIPLTVTEETIIKALKNNFSLDYCEKTRIITIYEH